MKKVLSIFLAAMLVFALAACGGTTSSSSEAASEATSESAAPAEGDSSTAEIGGEAAAPSGDAIVIGGLAPLTGDVSEYGIASSNGSKLAVEEINAAGGVLGRPVEFPLYDEQGDATEATNAYNRLVQQDKIIALVGDVTTKPTIAVAQKAVQDEIPMITPTGSGAEITKIGDNIFRACFTDPYQGELMAHYAQDKLGAKKVALLYDTGDDYSAGIAEVFNRVAGELGMEVVANEGYQSGATDFNSQLTKIKNAGPDVVMAPCYYTDAINILVQARGIGMEMPFLGPDGWDSVIREIDSSNYDALNNSFYCSQYSSQNPSPELEAFMTKYKDAYGIELNMFAILGYDAMHMMAKAINEAGSEDPAAIVAALQNLEYESLTGPVDFRGGNDPARTGYIVEFKDGSEEVLGAYNF